MSILDTIDAAFAADLDCNTDKVVLLALARHADENGVSWLSWSTLEEITRRSRGTVWRSLRRLEQAGEIVKRPWFMEFHNGRQSANCYVLTSVSGAGDAAEAALAASGARRRETESRWRDGEGRESATGRVATARPHEVITRTNQPNTDGMIGQTPRPKGGEEKLQQPDAGEPGHAETGYTEPAYAAWQDCFGELTNQQSKFIANTLKAYGEEELLRVLGAVRAQIDAGTTINKPAKYVKVALQRAHYRMVDDAIAAEARHRQPAAPAHDEERETFPAGLREWLIEQGRIPATPDREQQQQEWEAERAEERRQEAERKLQQELQREQQRARSTAEAEERHRQEIAKRIAREIDNPDAALRIADDFLRVPMKEVLRENRLSSLCQRRGGTLDNPGPRLSEAQAVAVLHNGLLAVKGA